MATTGYDSSVPALLLTIGAHEWDYGALATVRTLGRVGVPMWATVGRPLTPLAASRYLTAAVPWPTTGAESAGDLVAAMRRMAEGIGVPAVAIAGDDETAVLLAAHREELAECLRLPHVAPELPAQLAGKSSLAALCAAHGTPAPRSLTPSSWTDVTQLHVWRHFPSY